MIGREIIQKIIGYFTDWVHVPYSLTDENSLMAYMRTGYQHIHGESFLLPLYAAPVTLTSSAAAWSLDGAKTTIINKDQLAKPFDLHWCGISAISAELDGVIDIFAGDETEEVKIGAVDVERTSNFSRESALPLQIPQQPAGTRISARFTDSTASARTVRIKLYGHFYG
jgi:hypothetical protein